jgi:hypothetical protein
MQWRERKEVERRRRAIAMSIGSWLHSLSHSRRATSTRQLSVQALALRRSRIKGKELTFTTVAWWPRPNSWQSGRTSKSCAGSLPQTRSCVRVACESVDIVDNALLILVQRNKTRRKWVVEMCCCSRPPGCVRIRSPPDPRTPNPHQKSISSKL